MHKYLNFLLEIHSFVHYIADVLHTRADVYILILISLISLIIGIHEDDPWAASSGLDILEEIDENDS